MESRTIERLGARRLTTVGALLMAVGSVVVAVGLLDVPLYLPYVGWALGAGGMGIVFPTIPLSVMGEVEEGREAGELSSTILMDYLGFGIGAGLAGASVALADRRCLDRDRPRGRVRGRGRRRDGSGAGRPAAAGHARRLSLAGVTHRWARLVSV